MSAGVSGYDLAPALGVIGAGVLVALVPLLWFWRRQGRADAAARLHALALLVLVLSFDLVLLGAFTRLSDSGLGCPDWPGCYGHATPLGASAPIASAEAAIPTGAVTVSKAWIEMAHRYAATGIGVLVLVLAALALVAARRPDRNVDARWALVTLLWICVQGAFGALTVTLRLYPAIVTLHLLGGMGLLALLAIQAESYAPRRLLVTPGLRIGLIVVAVLTVVQIALGGWVSSNYAVLACSDFPTCQGAWWPEMDIGQGFVVRRALGSSGGTTFLPFAALTAIHMAHRLGALMLLPALAALAWRLHGAGGEARPWSLAIAALIVWQAASGLGNVLFGWPLLAAVAHTAGAAALVVVLTVLLVRSAPLRATRSSRDAGGAPALAS
jgi:cytochrome c oxidase assembly protein subunit 15